MPDKPRKRRPTWQKPGLTRAQRVVAFVEGLRITSGLHAGRRLRLRPWQKEIVEALYATDEAGRRRVRVATITMPRKGGKTTLAAGLALNALVGSEVEPRGQIYSAAADRTQAALIFAEMVAFLEGDPQLRERVNIKSFTKEIVDLETGSIYRALSADARKAHGLSPSFAVLDECAQWKSRDLYDGLLTGTGARAEPLMVLISTQSSSPAHFFSELVSHGRKVLDGTLVDPDFYAKIYEAPPDADPFSEDVWRACNPALGDFRSLDDFRAAAERARTMPSFQAAYRNLYLNQIVDPVEHYIGQADWLACGGAIDVEALRGRPCFGGLDLSSNRDLTALSLYFPSEGAVLCWTWIPGETAAAAEQRDRVPYAAWQRAGWVEPMTTRTIDHHAIARRIGELSGVYSIEGLAYDRWGVEPLKRVLADEGVTVALEPWGQGFRDMSPCVSELERLVLNQSLRHGDNALLTWCVSNARIASDAAAGRKVVKPHPDSPERVDALIAVLMSVGLAARQPAPVEYDFSRPLVLVG